MAGGDDDAGAAGAVRRSPRLERLRADLADGTQGALDAFWAEVAERGTPLVEAAPPGSADPTVTLLWRDATATSVLVGGGLSGRPPGLSLERAPDTDVWHRSLALPPDMRTMYWFAPGGDLEDVRSWRSDPLNPQRFVYFEADAANDMPAIDASILELPDAPSDAWARPRPGVPRGRTDSLVVASEILGNERRVDTYLPAHADPGGDGYGLLVMLDGTEYVDRLAVTTILDNLVAEGVLPPMIGVFPDSLSQDVRSVEMGCHPPFDAFLERELLPVAERVGPLNPDPRRRIIGGSSFGGLAAAFAGLMLPEVFGGVLSQSGAFQWRRPDQDEPAWLPRNLPASSISSRFSLRVGTLEDFDIRIINESLSLLEANRSMRRALEERGAQVDYREFSGGHDHVCWRQLLAEQLVELTAGT
jgi:enterochelin esterase family protein